MIKAVLFDLDGVLIPAVEWHYEALNYALNLFGYSIKRDDHIKIYNGLPTKDKLNIMSEKQGLPKRLHAIIRKVKSSRTDILISTSCGVDYSKKIMLKVLKDKGIKLAVCSNATKESVEFMLNKAGLIEYFDIIVGNNEGLRSKPEPDIYNYTMEKLEISKEETIIVEDAPHGVKAAILSGAHVIKVENTDMVDLSLFTNFIN